MNKFIKMLSLFIVGLAFLSSRRRGAVTPPAGDDEMRRARRRSLSLACCTREAFRDLPASAACRCCCLRRAQPAASAELATATIDQRGAAAASGYASGRSALRLDARRAPPPLLPTCPLRHPAAADDHERALAGAQNATRRTVAADNQLDKQWTALTETLSAARGARTERAADALLDLFTRNFHMWAVHAVEEGGQLASGSG